MAASSTIIMAFYIVVLVYFFNNNDILTVDNPDRNRYCYSESGNVKPIMKSWSEIEADGLGYLHYI